MRQRQYVKSPDRPALPTDYRATAAKGWSPTEWYESLKKDAQEALNRKPKAKEAA